MQHSTDRMTLAEAIERLDERERPRRSDLSSVQNSSSKSWDLNTDFAAAKILAEAGWLERADELWKAINSLALKIDCGVKDYYDVTGESVDVGRYLSGEPECMMAQQISPLAAVPVLLNISARSDADATMIFNRGIAVAAVIHALQSSGRGVSLTLCESVDASRQYGRHDTIITLQEFGEYINPGRLAFWAAHPAALRRCIFRYNEQQSDDVRDRIGFFEGAGYGRPIDMDKSKIPSGTVYIPFPETYDLERRFRTPESALREVIREFTAKGVPIEVSGEMPEAEEEADDMAPSDEDEFWDAD